MADNQDNPDNPAAPAAAAPPTTAAAAAPAAAAPTKQPKPKRRRYGHQDQGFRTAEPEPELEYQDFPPPSPPSQPGPRQEERYSRPPESTNSRGLQDILNSSRQRSTRRDKEPSPTPSWIRRMEENDSDVEVTRRLSPVPSPERRRRRRTARPVEEPNKRRRLENSKSSGAPPEPFRRRGPDPESNPSEMADDPQDFEAHPDGGDPGDSEESIYGALSAFARDSDPPFPRITNAQALLMLPLDYINNPQRARHTEVRWTQDAEDMLRERVWTDEEEQLAIAHVHSPAGRAERGLWAQTLYMYRTHLPDLFRYGLKPYIDAKGRSPHLSQSMCTRLSALLLSHVWCRDINRVRYALQTAVIRRRGMRHTPMPSPGTQTPPQVADLGLLMETIVELGKSAYTKAKSFDMKERVASLTRAAYDPMQQSDDLFRQIITAIRDAPTVDAYPFDAREDASPLYLLREQDVLTVCDVVDWVLHGDPGPGTSTCLGKHQSHFKDPDQWQQYFELDVDCLLDWKKQYFLSAVRDYTVAHWRQREASHPEYPDHFLLDAPRTERANVHNWQSLVKVSDGAQLSRVNCLHWWIFTTPCIQIEHESRSRSLVPADSSPASPPKTWRLREAEVSASRSATGRPKRSDARHSKTSSSKRVEPSPSKAPSSSKRAEPAAQLDEHAGLERESSTSLQMLGSSRQELTKPNASKQKPTASSQAVSTSQPEPEAQQGHKAPSPMASPDEPGAAQEVAPVSPVAFARQHSESGNSSTTAYVATGQLPEGFFFVKKDPMRTGIIDRPALMPFHPPPIFGETPGTCGDVDDKTMEHVVRTYRKKYELFANDAMFRGAFM